MKQNIKLFLSAFSVFLTISGCGGGGERATLAVRNAVIWTGDSLITSAQALAVKGDKFIFVGRNEEAEKYITNNTDVIDGKDMLVVPGFIDSHLHFLEGGFRLSSVQLRDASTPAEFVSRIAEYAKTVTAGTWITGGDWDHTLWGGILPEKSWIDSVTSDIPVWINRLDGHMSLANSAALKIAEIDRNTGKIEGGTIVRDASGEPTGILKDNAMYLVDKVVPPPSDEQLDRALRAAMKYVVRAGVTSVHHMGGFNDLKVFERANSSGNLTTRIYAAVPLSEWKKLSEKMANDDRGDDYLRIGALKGFADGSLGSQTAAFFEHYENDPENTGLLVNTRESLYSDVRQADSAGLQVFIHAIGDKANAMILDIYEDVNTVNGNRDRRFRIEHAQHLRPDDIERFGRLKVIASMQPYHAIDDGRWAEKYIGPNRIKTTYAFRSLLKGGCIIVFGSDWYVAPPTPLEGIYAAVTRRTLDGLNPRGWVPEEKIPVEEALKAYTINAAYASFEENVKGSIQTGKLADFVILDRNIFEIPPEEIPDTEILYTVVGGRIIFKK